MKIRRYIGNNTQEAILKVKMDLGNDALILNTRRVKKKGFFKILSKPVVEVLAAVDEYYGKNREREIKPVEKPKIEEKPIIRTNTMQAQRAYSNSSTNNQVKTDIKLCENGRINVLEDKIIGVETLLDKIYNKLNKFTSIKTETVSEEVEEHSEVIDSLSIFYNNLVENDVEPEIASSLLNKVAECINDDSSVKDIEKVLYNVMKGVLEEPELIDLDDKNTPQVVIFVGPTGVGKTTTIAKIAANYALNKNKKVGLITADTYRIAAVEQLKTYAEILSMPVDVVYTPSEIKEVIAKNNDKDLILIDTAGRSYKNKPHFDELKSLISATNADKVYLLMSMTTSYKTCMEIIENYSFLDNYDLIMTKIDEAPANGIILNTKIRTNKKLSYISTGQSVPDDIEIANIDRITKSIIGSIKDE